MHKNIVVLSLLFAFTFCCVQGVTANPPFADVQEERVDNGINITVTRSTVNVVGAEGLTLEVVSLTGRKVATIKIESPAQRVELNIPKGCYILKIGTVVRKVSIR